MSREAMQQALEALELYQSRMSVQMFDEAVRALRQALQTDQEPVAWRTFDGEGGYDYRSYEMNETYDKEWAERNPNHKGWVEPLYTAPLKREWVGLTDEEIGSIDVVQMKYIGSGEYVIEGEYEFARAIEAKLKEKNNG